MTRLEIAEKGNTWAELPRSAGQSFRAKEYQYLTHAPQHSFRIVMFAGYAVWPAAKRNPRKKYSRSSRIR
jgi:hypothetical protein